MTGSAFRDRMRVNPFQSFLVKTADGDTFIVDHPDFAMISPHATEIIIYDKDNHFRVVSMNHDRVARTRARPDQEAGQAEPRRTGTAMPNALWTEIAARANVTLSDAQHAPLSLPSTCCSRRTSG